MDATTHEQRARQWQSAASLLFIALVVLPIVAGGLAGELVLIRCVKVQVLKFQHQAVEVQRNEDMK